MKEKTAWRYMTLLKASQEADNKTRHLSWIDFQILTYIGWRQGHAYINEILEHPMFKYYSLSTIKRSILLLKEEDLIYAKSGDKDSRVMCLTLKER